MIVLSEQIELDLREPERLCANPQCAAEYGPWPLSAFANGRDGYCGACTAEGLAPPVLVLRQCDRCGADATRRVCYRCMGIQGARAVNANPEYRRRQRLGRLEFFRRHFLAKHARRTA